MTRTEFNVCLLPSAQICAYRADNVPKPDIIERCAKRHAQDCIRKFESGSLPTSRTVLRNLSSPRKLPLEQELSNLLGPRKAKDTQPQSSHHGMAHGTFAAREPIKFGAPKRPTGERKVEVLSQIENWRSAGRNVSTDMRSATTICIELCVLFPGTRCEHAAN